MVLPAMNSVAEPKRLGEVALDQADIGRPARFAAGPAGFEIAGQQLVQGQSSSASTDYPDRWPAISRRAQRLHRTDAVRPAQAPGWSTPAPCLGFSASARSKHACASSKRNEPHMDDAKIAVGFGVAADRAPAPGPVIDQRLLEPHRVREANAAYLIEGYATRLDLVGLIEIGQRFVIAFQIEQQLRAGARSLQMARIELQGMLKTQHGLVANAPA